MFFFFLFFRRVRLENFSRVEPFGNAPVVRARVYEYKIHVEEETRVVSAERYGGQRDDSSVSIFPTRRTRTNDPDSLRAPGPPETGLGVL